MIFKTFQEIIYISLGTNLLRTNLAHVLLYITIKTYPEGTFNISAMTVNRIDPALLFKKI